MISPEHVSLIGFAFTAGVFTFFAPCAYPLLPGYISYYLGQTATSAETSSPRANGGVEPSGFTRYLTRGLNTVFEPRLARRLARALVISLLVSAGFFVVYGLLAGIVGLVGVRSLSRISLLELLVGALLIVIGAVMLTGWEPPTPSIRLPERRRTSSGYFGFGILYAAAAAGCTAPIFIAVALKALSVGPTLSLVTFGAYAAGMSVLLTCLTILAALGRDTVLTWSSGRTDLIYRTAGGLLILAGIVQLYFFLFRFNGLSLLGL